MKGAVKFTAVNAWRICNFFHLWLGTLILLDTGGLEL